MLRDEAKERRRAEFRLGRIAAANNLNVAIKDCDEGWRLVAWSPSRSERWEITAPELDTAIELLEGKVSTTARVA